MHCKKCLTSAGAMGWPVYSDFLAGSPTTAFSRTGSDTFGNSGFTLWACISRLTLSAEITDETDGLTD